jgi:hypothetical protein
MLALLVKSLWIEIKEIESIMSSLLDFGVGNETRSGDCAALHHRLCMMSPLRDYQKTHLEKMCGILFTLENSLSQS